MPFPCVTVPVVEDDEWDEEHPVWEEGELEQAETDTATVIELAALMLDEAWEVNELAYTRALQIPLSDLASTLIMATSMLASLAEHLSKHHDCSPEQVLLELRTWTEGAPDNDN